MQVKLIPAKTEADKKKANAAYQQGQKDWRAAVGESKELTLSHKCVLLIMQNSQNWEKGTAWMKNDTLANQCGTSPSTVKRALAAGIKAGFIQKEKRRFNGAPSTIEYSFHIPTGIPTTKHATGFDGLITMLQDKGEQFHKEWAKMCQETGHDWDYEHMVTALNTTEELWDTTHGAWDGFIRECMKKAQFGGHDTADAGDRVWQVVRKFEEIRPVSAGHQR